VNNGLGQDIRFGFRQLVGKPGVPLLIVVLLALGIGVNTAVFSVVKAVVLEPLPFDSPDQLVGVWETNPEFNRQPVSGPTFRDWREQSQSFEHLVAFRPYPTNLTGEGDPERVLRTTATTGLFELLRVQPALGRTSAREEEEPGRNRVAILSDGLWKRRFGADPDLLGHSIALDGELHTVVGIMPPGFQNPSPWRTGETTDIWTPFTFEEFEFGLDRDTHWIVVVGRIGDGLSIKAAQDEMTTIARRLEEQYPDAMKDQGVHLVRVREDLVGRYTGQLVMLLGAAVLVLFIACGNVAGLLIAKSTTRQTEVAVRASLGASRSRLIRQLLTENLPLFLIGGGMSVLVAIWGVQVLRASIPTNILPQVDVGHRIDESISDLLHLAVHPFGWCS
jgi:predicted permease